LHIRLTEATLPADGEFLQGPVNREDFLKLQEDLECSKEKGKTLNLNTHK
jgi:hypothetical protein